MCVATLTLQTVQDGRQFLKYVDPKLGVPLPERDYGGNCLIYDADNKTDPFHNVWVRSPGSEAWGGPGAAPPGASLEPEPLRLHGWAGAHCRAPFFPRVKVCCPPTARAQDPALPLRGLWRALGPWTWVRASQGVHREARGLPGPLRDVTHSVLGRAVGEHRGSRGWGTGAVRGLRPALCRISWTALCLHTSSAGT